MKRRRSATFQFEGSSSDSNSDSGDDASGKDLDIDNEDSSSDSDIGGSSSDSCDDAPVLNAGLADESDEEQDASADDAALLLAMEFAEQVGIGSVTPTGAGSILKIFERWYESRPEHTDTFPLRSWYLVKKMALGAGSKGWIARSFCPRCDYLFPADDMSVVVCPNCTAPSVARFDTGGKAVRVAVYWSIPRLLKTLFSSPLLAKSANWGTTHTRNDERPVSERHMDDIWCGRLFQELHYDNPDPAKIDYLYFYLSCDAVEVQKGLSPTPLTGLLLNFTPAIRNLLASVFLFGLVPGGIKDHQTMYYPWLKQFASYGPGTKGITVYDAHMERDRTFFLVIAVCVNDLRGLPGMVNGRYGPAINGSCNACEVTGIAGTHKNTKILPGCVCMLPMTANAQGTFVCTLSTLLCMHAPCVFVWIAARVWWRQKQGNAPSKVLWNQPSPTTRTHESIKDHQHAGAKARTEKEKQARHYKDVSTLGMVPGMNLHDRVYADDAHEVANVAKQVFTSIYNRKKDGRVKYGKKDAAKEKALGRDIKPEWIASPGACEILDDQLLAARNPSCWPNTRQTFEYAKRLKTAEWLSICGDAGAYLIREALPASSKVRPHFIDLMRILEMYDHTGPLTHVRTYTQDTYIYIQTYTYIYIYIFVFLDRCKNKTSTPGVRQEMKRRMTYTMTRLEGFMPLNWSTLVMHWFACHMVWQREMLGPFWASNMLVIERFHTKIKALWGDARADYIISGCIRYDLYRASQHNRLHTAEAQWATDPLQSSASGEAGRADEDSKREECVAPRGKGQPGTLSDGEFMQVMHPHGMCVRPRATLFIRLALSLLSCPGTHVFFPSSARRCLGCGLGRSQSWSRFWRTSRTRMPGSPATSA
jgi:hypothetical protein